MTVLYTALHRMWIAGLAGSAAAGLMCLLLACARRVSLRWQYRLWTASATLFLLPVCISLRQATVPAPLGKVTVYLTETAARPLPPPSTAAVPQVTWGDVAAAIWLSVALILFLRCAVGYALQMRRLRRNTQAVSCALLAEYTARRVQVRQGACVVSPLLAGAFRPTLYLPEHVLSEQQLRHVLAHETVHLHRGDLWIKRICLLVRWLHWYNPVAHAVCRRVAAVCETSCDMAAIKRCDGDRSAYLSTVLLLLCANVQGDPPGTAMACHPRQIKARFLTVSTHRSARGVTVVTAAAAVLLLVGALCSGAVYAGRDSAPHVRPDVKVPTTSVADPAPPTVEENGESGFRWPLLKEEGAVSSAFGYRWGRFHRGVDIAAEVGDPVVAASRGAVIACEGRSYNGGYGMAVVIDHGKGLRTVYSHLEEITVSVGEQVAAGQVIALAGMTGNVTGPCLHFEVLVDNEAVDPLVWLDNVCVRKKEENENNVG